MMLATFDARAPCRLMLRLLSPKIPRAFAEEVVLSLVPPLQSFFPSLVQDFASVLVKFHEVPITPLLQHVQVPLDGSHALKHVNQFSQFVSLPSDELSDLKNMHLCVYLVTDKQGQVPRQIPGQFQLLPAPDRVQSVNSYALGLTIQQVIRPSRFHLYGL